MKEIDVILKTDTTRVRVMSLAPREAADWHYHTEVTDHIFCLTGTILVRIKDPTEDYILQPGQRCGIKTGRIHQLENLDNMEATYLLVQGIGRYDFNVIEK